MLMQTKDMPVKVIEEPIELQRLRILLNEVWPVVESEEAAGRVKWDDAIPSEIHFINAFGKKCGTYCCGLGYASQNKNLQPLNCNWSWGRVRSFFGITTRQLDRILGFENEGGATERRAVLNQIIARKELELYEQ